ncbi:MAG: lipoyl(octanoyl) transferase LipB [Prevotellaceae bacterium]|jgi:lipoyl(octanoyl) transferase|nr:lipoyl(octanoyl) transferase LipB [Prevotellaceae bacterium]
MFFLDWGIIDYAEAWERQRAIAARLIARKTAHPSMTISDDEPAAGTVVFCEHPHVYTLGRHGNTSNLLIDADRLAQIGARYYQVDRGGDITYHGPGQIVCYPVLDLERLHLSLKQYIFTLEETVIRTLRQYGVTAGRLAGATGIWLDAGRPSARKIGAIGVHASHYVTTHGLALNINTDLRYYQHIHPCGFTDKGVTSLAAEIGAEADIDEVKQWLQKYFVSLTNE